MVGIVERIPLALQAIFGTVADHNLTPPPEPTPRMVLGYGYLSRCIFEQTHPLSGKRAR